MQLPVEFPQSVQLFLLKGEATREDVTAVCSEARSTRVRGICVHSSQVVEAYAILEDSDVKVACMVGFPFGTGHSDAKRYEAEAAIDDGAQEIELVLNLGKVKEGDRAYLLRELRDVVDVAEERPVTVVAESSILSEKEKTLVAHVAVEGGAKFLKTSTGLQVASPEDVKFLATAVEDKIGVIATGHVPTADAAAALIAAGAQRVSIPVGSTLLRDL